MISLRQFITMSAASVSPIFEHDGALSKPFWHAITGAGEALIVPGLPDVSKDTMALMVRQLFEHAGVVRYVWVCEAWLLERHETRMTDIDSITDEPDCIEVLSFSAEDAQEGMLTAHREIKRDHSGRPRLEPLIIHSNIVESQGRMVGLLPVTGVLQ